MPLRPAPDLPGTFYATVASLGADGRGRPVAHLAVLAPGDGLTEDAVLGIAHRFVLSGARFADRGGRVVGDLVESGLAPPGGLDWHGVPVREGTWVVTLRPRDDADLQHVFKSARRLVLHPVVEGDADKRGGDDVDERTLRRILDAALRPVLDSMARAEVRLKRLEDHVRADPFGDAVRGRGDAGTRELQRLMSLLRRVDPVGEAISERRPLAASSHPTLDALRPGGENDAPLDPRDPFGDAVTRPRAPVRRPMGVSLPAQRGEQR